MIEDAKIPESKARPRRAPTLYFIIGFKLLKGTVALLLALKVRTLNEENLPAQFQKLLMFLHLDPEKKFFADLADRVAEITPTNLQWVVIFSVIYSLFMMMQAVGLIFRVSWIVWLVIGESAFFVPIELFELVHRPSWIKFSILAVNVFIVWYLFVNRARLIKHHHHD
jgi:uncharacterized membrane protein (DUF2068 family)